MSEDSSSDDPPSSEDPSPGGRRVQEPFLNELRKSRRNVQIYLRSGRRLEGVLASFDPHMIQLDGAEQQTVFKHEIMSIARAPMRKGKPYARRPSLQIQGAPSGNAVKRSPSRPVLRLRRAHGRDDSE
jgi:RNA chaperone Hfq